MWCLSEIHDALPTTEEREFRHLGVSLICALYKYF